MRAMDSGNPAGLVDGDCSGRAGARWWRAAWWRRAGASANAVDVNIVSGWFADSGEIYAGRHADLPASDVDQRAAKYPELRPPHARYGRFAEQDDGGSAPLAGLEHPGI